MMGHHALVAQMMHSAPVTTGVILEDEFTTGNVDAPLVGRLTPTGGYEYLAGDDTPTTAYKVDPNNNYWKDGVKDQYGLAYGVSSSSDKRESHYIPDVFQTNNYRAEFDFVQYQGGTAGSYYNMVTAGVQCGNSFDGMQNGVRLYTFPFTSVQFYWLLHVFKDGVKVEIDRGPQNIVTSQFEVIEAVIERNGDHLYVSLDGNVLFNGTEYANDLPTNTDKSMLIAVRSKNVGPRTMGKIKVTAL